VIAASARRLDWRLAPLLAAGLLACSDPAAVNDNGDDGGDGGDNPPAATLRGLATARGIGMGAAAGSAFMLPESRNPPFMTILGREFSVLTAENDMKHASLQPQRGVFRFGRPDSMIAWAESKNMKVRGHTLIWHNQTASWFTAGSWPQDTARALMRDHITKVLEHFRGKAFAWDVVNEPLDDGGAMRQSAWYQYVGADYIELAFRWAREADPAALLFWNDYNIEGPGAKSDATYDAIRELKAKGVPIDGIGFQGHFQVNNLPSRQQLVDNFTRFAALGLKIHITELDIRMPMPATDANRTAQADNYRLIAEACRAVPACEAIVVWGVSDKDSWVPSTFPGWGAPLLYDDNFYAKPAYWSLREAFRT